ncbi:MAG TPA: zinc ribbon domain-containing protein [Anaerolineae bacterium]|nr:zinc ribbon domain-containing protein [Anaerolineae bacterium]
MSEDILLCPACKTENDALNRTCVNCGESLIVVCPRCNTVNAITAEKCFACGQQFDTLGHIIARHEVRFEDRFTRQAVAASDAKSEQKEKDHVRSQDLWAQERRRQEYLQTQKLRQKQQERYLAIGVAVAAVIVVALILLISLAR